MGICSETYSAHSMNERINALVFRGNLIPAVVALVDAVVLFPLVGSIDGVKTDLLPVQGGILFRFVGGETGKIEVGPAI